MIYAFIVFVALQVVDAWLTLKIIGQGGRELNPAVAWAMARLGNLWGLVAVKAVGIGVVLLILPWVPLAVMWALCAGYAVLAAWNAAQLRR